MKLISCNIWCGIEFDSLTAFVEQQAADTDVFCFQEMLHNTAGRTSHRVGGPGQGGSTGNTARANLYDELSTRLPGFDHTFEGFIEGYDFAPIPGENLDNPKLDYDLQLGLAIFTRKDLGASHPEHLYVYRTKNIPSNNEGETFARCLQSTSFSHHDQTYTINNFHGLWVPGGKVDNPERIIQSEKIAEAMKKQPGKRVLTGDLNLWPDTKSLAILEDGMRNLITEFGITNTRTDFYNSRKHLHESPHVTYADYTLVSPNVEVTSFEVPDVPISDHRPMILEFS